MMLKLGGQGRKMYYYHEEHMERAGEEDYIYRVVNTSRWM
jgi:hypothetical protein